MSSCSLSPTVLAWLQKELSLYSELFLIPPMSDVPIDKSWQEKALVCLAHRYFPDSIPNLAEALQSNSKSVVASAVFEQQLSVLTNSDSSDDYMRQIQAALVDSTAEEEDTTLRDLHIGNTNPPSLDKQLDEVMIPLNRLFHQLVDLSIRGGGGNNNQSTRSPSPRILPSSSSSNENNELLPIVVVEEMISLEEIQDQLNALKTKELIELKETWKQLPPQFKNQLKTRVSAMDATRAALHLQLHKGDKLRTTIQFSSTVSSIRNELEFIQAKMLKTTTTDIGIQDLETRTSNTGKSIDQLKIKFQELLLVDDHCLQEFDSLFEKYKLICTWVDDVRVWFVEAERIRKWIEERIQALESINNLNALDEVELDFEALEIDRLNSDQRDLEKQVELFDKEDMTRLRAHVKALTGGNKDLSPADTTTIEITFTTLMTLDRLMHLLRRHGYELQMLTLRMYWEQHYDVSVVWVRTTGEKVKFFVQHKARWRPPPLPEDNTTTEETKRLEKNEIIDTLIDFEKQSTVFDQGQFTTTVNMYQDLDDACNIELPSHLESRQVAIEEAFEELTNRIGFARQVVEQYLVVTDFLDRADKLKFEGDKLRQDITLAAEQHSQQSNHGTKTDFSEKVSHFQENAVRLVTSVASRVPYPEATHPTDEQGNDDANEVIRMVIGARKSALVLFGEALDHSLGAYRRALHLQKRAKQLQDEMNRLQSWVDERMRSIKKSKVDVFVGKCALDETDLARLNKERDGQVAKLKGIKDTEIKKLIEHIQGLETACSQPPTNLNTVTMVEGLNDGMHGLEEQLNVLQEALQVHSLCLDILGKRISWETQHAKTTVWISNMTFSVWEFISRKAQWRTDMDLELDRLLVQEEFNSMETKVQEFYLEQLKPVDQTFNELSNGFRIILNSANFDTHQAQDHITPEHVQRRQDTLDQSYQNLSDLIEYSKQVLSQYTALSDFSTQVSTLSNQGLSLISEIQQANETIMKLPNFHICRDSFISRVKEFGQAVVQVWMQSGSQLPYPQCPEDARTTRPSTSDDEISTEVATIIFKMYTELQDLLKRMTDLLQRLDVVIDHRLLLEKWCLDSENFETAVKELTQEIDSIYTFDLNTGHVMKSNSNNDVPDDIYLEKSKSFEKQVLELMSEKYEPLLSGLEDLKRAVENDEQVKSVIDPVVTQATMIALESSWQDLNDRVRHFQTQAEACHHRTYWESLWKDQWGQLNTVQEGVREWMNEKNVWISSTQGDLDTLISRMQVFDTSLKQLEQKTDPLEESFDDMMASFTSCHVYTTSVETKQDELDKLFNKLQELVTTQLSEIQFLKERHDWESRVDLELKTCNEKALETELFVRNVARWKPSTTHDNLDKRPTADTQVKALKELLDHLSHLQNENPTLLQSELIFKRKFALEATMERVQEHVKFVDQVLDQRNMILTRLNKISELESLAESIKTGLLSSDKVNGQEQADLKEYNLRVSQLETSMSYPVRHYRDHDALCREQDVEHNMVVTDMLSARRVRLDELATSLESILKSKERLSKCKAAEETYMSEANTVKSWMESRMEQLKQIQPDEKDIQQLRVAVNALSSLESSAVTYTSSVQALKESSNQCVIMIQQQGDDEEDILSRIQTTQANINTSWKDLVDDIESTKKRLSSVLREQEYISCVDAFKSKCQELSYTVSSMKLEEVTEEVSNSWQHEIELLSTQSFEHIKSRLTEEKTKDVSTDLVQNMSDQYQQVVEQFEAFKVLVAEKTIDANHDRLKKEYFVGAESVNTCMKETRAALDGACRRIIYGKDIKQDEATVNQVTQSYQSLCDVFENHHETYDEQRSFYRFLQLNKVSGLSEVDKCQQDLELRWKQLKQDVLNDKRHADSVSQWFDIHVKLIELQNEHLQGVFERLDQMVLNEDTMPSFLEQDASLLKWVESRLSGCWDIATGLTDNGNLDCFKQRYDTLKSELKRATELLAEKKHQAQQHVDLVACQRNLSEVQDAVDTIQKEIDQRLNGFKVEENSSKVLEQLYRSFSTGLSSTETQQKKILGQAGAVQELLNTFKSKYPKTEEDVKSMQSQLEESLEMLNTSLESEQAANDVLRRVLGHAKSAETISTWVENCHTATAHVLSDELDESEAMFELTSLEQKLVEFEHVITSFKELSSTLLSMETEGNDNDDSMVQELINIVKQNAEEIEKQWCAAHNEFKEVEAAVQKTAQGAAIARKIKHVMAIVGETREYVHGFKLFDSDDNSSVQTMDVSVTSDLGDTQSSDLGDLPASDTQASSDDEEDVGDELTTIEEEKKEVNPESIKEESVKEESVKEESVKEEIQSLSSMLREFEVENIQRNLKSMESDTKPQIESEMEQLNTMISNVKDIDSMFIRQHEQVQESVVSLNRLFDTKYAELEKAMDIGKYLRLADDIEILQTSLEEAVSKSAPHHATLIGSSFSRTDLHAKLIELDARFNYYEKKIVQNMTSAKQQAMVVIEKEEPESTLVANHLKEMEQKWSLIKKQFKTRKIELSRTIDTSIDPHDQQARIRKSSLPTRKASSILRERADASTLARQRLSPTASSSSNSSKGSVNRLNPNRSTGRYLAPPLLQHQPSKSATHVKPKPARVTVPKPPLNSYVADPHNDLDMEIGRIVNETPYRVKVKMVPGEVGRYWFGNLNPKLAYCRVLKSKMVMVRVGGGWTELSQFLRDHALLEGDFIPRSRRGNTRAKMIPEEDEPKSPTIQEGFIETRRDLGRQQQQQQQLQQQQQQLQQQQLQQQRSISPQNRSSTTTNSSRSSTSNQPVGSPSHSSTTGYKDGNKFIAVDHNGNQLEVKMRKVVDAPTVTAGRNMSSTTANTNDYTRRRMARRREKEGTATSPSSSPQKVQSSKNAAFKNTF